MKSFLEGTNKQATANLQKLMPDFFNPTNAQQTELALRVGNQRFGSACEHAETRNGKCVNCLREVITREVITKL